MAHGLLAIRSHVDICDDRLLAVEALLEVKQKIAPYIDLQLVAFPQDGYLRARPRARTLERALDMGVDVVGGIPHFERTMADGAAVGAPLCEIAAERGLLVDMHCDETDDPLSRHIETLAAETQRAGPAGPGDRLAPHLDALHGQLLCLQALPLMAEAELGVDRQSADQHHVQGRHDTYPKRRGMTRVPE